VLHNQRDGFTKNLTTGNMVEEQENWSVRTALRWLPTDNLDVIWRFDHHDVDNIGRPASSVAYGPRIAGPAFNTVENDDELPSTREITGTSLHLDYDLGWATLTSISSYREYETLNPEEQDGSTNIDYRFNDYNAEDNRQWSQELRLSGDLGDSFRWTVGGIYSEENAEQRSGVTIGTHALDRRIIEGEVGLPYENFAPGTGYDLAFAFVFPGVPRLYANGAEALAAGDYTEFIDVESFNESWGIFADVTWAITDTLDLTVGVRYNEDDKRFGRNVAINDFGMQFAFSETRVNANGELDPNGEQGWYFQEDSWDKTTGRVVLDWQALENALIYASWATGYKSGGFNSVSDRNDDTPFDMETVENIELGFKTTWLDNTLRVNGAVFSYDYGDLQEQEFIDGACLNQQFGTYQFLTSDVEGDGFELGINWLAMPGLELWANMGRVKADVTDRQRCVVVNGQPQNVNQAGTVHANEFSYSLGANYTVEMDNSARVVATVSWSKASDEKDRQSCYFVEDTADGQVAVTKFQMLNGVINVADDSAVSPYLDGNGNVIRDLPYSSCPDKDGREELTARVTYYSPSGNWEVGTWVTNATNWEDNGDPGGQATNLRSNFDDSSLSYSGAVEPTAYGLDLRYNF
jgi:iron complex outermembrane receptor protein